MWWKCSRKCSATKRLTRYCKPVLPTQDMLNNKRTEEQQILDEGRALEATCAVASSAPARAFKARLRKMATAAQVHHLAVYCEADYVALVRCALAIGISRAAAPRCCVLLLVAALSAL